MIISLYFGKGDGEIFLIRDIETGEDKMVTCIDISTVYAEKRGAAVDMIKKFANLKHPNLIEIEKYWVAPDEFIFIETEAPDPIAEWKSFCKKNLTTDEVFDVIQ